MKRKFAISDIHGCAKTFSALLEKIQFSTSDELFLLGDYLDRGPDTKGVFDKIFELKNGGHSVHCLRGNHEENFLNAFSDASDLDVFLTYGGQETLQSFRASSIWGVPKIYVEFIKTMGHFVEVDGFLLVHAGLSFYSQNPLADKNAMLWQRNWYGSINYDWLGGRKIVHGHTPVVRAEIESQFVAMEVSQFLNIDGGCVFGKSHAHKPGLGELVAFDLANWALIFQEKID